MAHGWAKLLLQLLILSFSSGAFAKDIIIYDHNERPKKIEMPDETDGDKMTECKPGIPYVVMSAKDKEKIEKFINGQYNHKVDPNLMP